MKPAKLIFIILFLIWLCGLTAQNHMELILSIQGGHENSLTYLKMAAIDFNADGYDDLIFPQHRSTPLSVPAMIHCYFGGPDFDGIPDLEYQGEFWDQDPGARLLSGDFNGDGYDDIVDSVPIDESTLQMGLRFYYGGPGADLMPDHIIPMASLGTPFSSELIIRENIGDINNDGCDDIGAFHITPDSLQTWSIAVLFGGTYQVATVVDDIYIGGVINISYVGDVNGDGIDDFSVGYDISQNPQYLRYLYLYYGNDGFWDPQDRVLLFEDNTTPFIYPYAFGIGDFNNDGYDDFLMNWVVDINNTGDKIKLGSSTLPQSSELIIDMAPWTQLINFPDREVSFGDFNGDGYSDMISSDHESGFWHGAAGLWLGGANPNGAFDLRITPPPVSPYYQFGWGTPAVGDFNGDGFDDVAFCAPQSQSGTSNYNGWVHVYAGNAQLADTTVENEDYSLQAMETKLTIFPNPSPKNQHELSYRLDGELPYGVTSCSIDIYNIRGQLITSYPLNNQESKQGTLGELSLAQGIYIASYVAGKQKVATTRFSIK
ncbi:MAG: FG-GAP repeat protein [Bacteroidetes bacterium ADurb.BinA104]|nr:MAG: FG-GAP repeat protein [Bacteroidetes bacterium ADurb.BinA104]